MKNIFLLFIILSLASCEYTNDRTAEQDNPSNTDASPEARELTDKELAAVSLEYYDTINVHHTDFVIIPIGANKGKTNKSRGFNLNLDAKMDFGYGSSSYKDDYNRRYFNLLFYNVKKDTSYLLFNQERAIINNVRANVNKEGASASQYIFYTIGDKDYNMDGLLNEEDSNHLFVSNKDGSELTQLTPNNSRILNWTIIKKSNIIIAEILVDTNDDKIFDRWEKGDDVRLVKIDLDKKKKGNPFLDKATEKQLKNQFLDLIVKTR